MNVGQAFQPDRDRHVRLESLTYVNLFLGGGGSHEISAGLWNVFASLGRAVRARCAGVSALDYMLVLGTILPCVAFIFTIGPKIMRLAYEMVEVLVSWPFM